MSEYKFRAKVIIASIDTSRSIIMLLIIPRLQKIASALAKVRHYLQIKLLAHLIINFVEMDMLSHNKILRRVYLLSKTL